MFTKYFGTVQWDSPTMGLINMPDLTKAIAIDPKYMSDSRYALDYTIADGERLDQLAHRIYGDERKYWLILLANRIYNLDEQWPLNPEEMDYMLSQKYPLDELLTVHHYLDIEGHVVDLFALAFKSGEKQEDVIASHMLTPVTIQEHEESLNEAKRHIKVIDPDLVGNIESDLLKEFSNVRSSL